jgi:hypothetical protein
LIGRSCFLGRFKRRDRATTVLLAGLPVDAGVFDAAQR